MEPKYIALLLFAVAYILFVMLPARRCWSAMIGALLLVLTGALSLRQALLAVNWNVMGVFVGTLVLADLFIESRMPARLAEKIVNHSPNSCVAILFICALTGVISAFVENVATLMIIAPIAFSLARKLNISPVKPLIAIAVSSNLQGAATLVGDPPSMLLAGFAKMNFADFFVYRGRPSIFFAVQIGALASLVFLYVVFRKERASGRLLSEERVLSLFPSVLLIVLIFALAFSSWLDPDFTWLAGALCMCAAAAGAVWDLYANRGRFLLRIKALDWNTTFFLVGVFVLVGGIAATGWTRVIARALSSCMGDNLGLGFVLMVLIAVVVSAFVDNVPFLAAMLPIVLLVSEKLAVEPTLFLFGLLLGASIGGNITPIGAASNIVCVGLLRKEGYQVGFRDFLRIGLPFTIVAITASCAFVWFIWRP